MDADLKQYIAPCKALAEQTALTLLDFWRRPQDLSIQQKPDGTPATAADLAAHRQIAAGLQAIAPGIPIISEEGEWPDYPQRAQWRQHWLIDPLDGTRGFIAHLEQFSINIALIADHHPVLGMIYVPVANTVYYAWRNGGAFKQVGAAEPQPIHRLEHTPAETWRIVVGQYSRGKRLAQIIQDRCRFQLLHGNGAVKFGWLAEGLADIYPRFGPISEWDTAAGQCILSESGGAVVDLQGRTLQYNRQASLLNPDFIAVADSRWVQQWLEILNLNAKKS